MSSTDVCGQASKDEQARRSLVAIAIAMEAGGWDEAPAHHRRVVRELAGFKDPSKGHWCAAGLTAAMEDAGLVVPEPGTSARRGAVALLDFVGEAGSRVPLDCATLGDRAFVIGCASAQPGDIIAWLQKPPPEAMMSVNGVLHAFDAKGNGKMSRCGQAESMRAVWTKGKPCSECAWSLRKGHVAVIVEVDEESITTVGWNEGKAPGRVEKRRLWRDLERTEVRRIALNRYEKRRVPRANTVLWRRPGGLYGVARPVAV